MSDRLIKLLIIDSDPIYRTGLRVVLGEFADLRVVAEAETSAAALQLLADLNANTTNPSVLGVDVVLLELRLENPQPRHFIGLELCQQLKTQYPNLPILLLSSVLEPAPLAAARKLGINGYCPKGISVADLIIVIRQVAAHNFYWTEEVGVGETQLQESQVRSNSSIPRILTTLSNRWRASGLQQIDAAMAEVMAQLQVPGLSLLEQAFLAGQRRELLASRWLINRLLSAPEVRSREIEERRQEQESIAITRVAEVATDAQISLATVQLTLFESIRAKLQFSLENLAGEPLEIDIFREEKKRELLNLILQKLESVLDELRFSQVQVEQLVDMRSLILRDLWQTATTDFFGKYSTLQVAGQNLEIVKFLLQDTLVVERAILDQIPLVVHLFSFLLFETPLIIDNVSYSASTPEAKARAEIILQNLLIELGSAVVQPLLNHFADVEVIKQNFYDKRLISTREIERFRNTLSWKYRWEYYINEPKAMFESRYELLVLANRGIAKISIYAPRRQQLSQLSGVRLAVTLALEIRDAIAPRLRAAVAFIGNGLVYVLTQVIGRAIGLVGRGILQGLGSTLPESKKRRF